MKSLNELHRDDVESELNLQEESTFAMFQPDEKVMNAVLMNLQTMENNLDPSEFPESMKPELGEEEGVERRTKETLEEMLGKGRKASGTVGPKGVEVHSRRDTLINNAKYHILYIVVRK